jgi:Leucine-rich repeat (LRR) protein
MIDLKSLDARGNQIKDIEGLTNCTQLTSVTLSDNQITDISVFAKSADNLEILTLGSNQISSISALSGMTALKILSVENNQITSVASLADCTQLTFLAAYANQITDVDGLEKCSSLAYLDLGENQIRDISPLVTLSSKTVGLLLQNNQISDISMLPTQIRYSGLVLYNNPIQDFSVLEQMENVKSSDILYLSWYDNMDYIPVASSGYGSEVTFVDVPYDQMANIKNTIKEVKNSYVSTPEFCTLEEADEQIAEYRSSMQSQYHVD